MGVALKALETTATVDDEKHLSLDEPLLGVTSGRVRVIVLVDEEYDASEIDEATWLQAASCNPAFDFLADPAEDIYTWEDGTPLDEK